MGSSSYYAPWLWILLATFVMRVVAQLALAVMNIPFLPPFEAWYSGAIPYPLLLALQIVIVGVCTSVAYRFRCQLVRPKRWLGICLLGFGAIYFTLMFVRLGAGLSGLSDVLWFNRPIPSFFHLILAMFVLLVGHFHFAASARKVTSI